MRLLRVNERSDGSGVGDAPQVSEKEIEGREAADNGDQAVHFPPLTTGECDMCAMGAVGRPVQFPLFSDERTNISRVPRCIAGEGLMT